MDTKEITHYAIQIGKLHEDGNYDDVKSLLTSLSNISVTLEQLQYTDIAKVLFQLLKFCPETTVKKNAKLLLSKWKKLYSGACTIPQKNDTKEHSTKATHEHETSEEVVSKYDSDELQNTVPNVTDYLSHREGSSHPVENNVAKQRDELQRLGVVEASQTPNEVSPLAEDTMEGKCAQIGGKNFNDQTDSQNPKAGEDSETSAYTSNVTSSHCGQTDLEIRTKCVELLLQALSPKTETASEQVSKFTALANEIEAQIYALHGPNLSKYKSCVRSKVANLRNPKNPHLRQGLLTGALTPKVFASMSAAEMASEELRRLREVYTTASINERQLPRGVEGTPTQRVRCRRCEGSDCTVTQISRGTLFLPSWARNGKADEDAMTFVTCNRCGTQWYHSNWICL
ncbi:transcription elongation factor A N-terminal and central domain-containing protein [Chanos chanos]|uniref:Transcription elongation factor A N-terminal and central domain-containing protein n=1 Tax=Chanos chanos TaxID=29144 RepID=A0A6J2VT08_CHACN|nr:transcription elongation factor A N-terminal and central domain-containing protein [Chanos chanos]